ncbi:MAG TPA: L-erythro-3,5-diaminohexanoate dehydrogenase [Candidatus Dormibacteraeota bacterium]|nr:L-erythro-3,5-diaminohexanoate dehydrogenase [Candidatus Dormibacteraeota bacterium]
MIVRSTRACRFGSHRVLDPPGALAQAAWRLDATPVAYENEILCDVDALNIDSASFAQLRAECGDDVHAIGERILATVRERGKQHNPVTGSGGMFVGRVREVGTALRDSVALQAGDRIASLVSLTLTPLLLERVLGVDLATGHVQVRGTAVLFESGSWATLPTDLDDRVALAVFDVAGAPAQMRRLCRQGDTVVVIGADGKSGILSCVEAKRATGSSGRVIGVVPNAASPGARLVRDHGFVDVAIEADARDALQISQRVGAAAPGGADLVVNCVNVAGTEAGTILCAKDGGSIYFFSMATSFTAAALGAEGLGKDVTMIVGSGFAPNHAEIALETLRSHPAVLAHFTTTYGRKS